MISLRAFFSVVLVVMIAVTGWASLGQNVFVGFGEVASTRWGLATLADAYCGFLTFFAWVVYKERGWLPRIAWFVLISLFGNIAMASYALWQLRKLGPSDPIEKFLLRTTEPA